MISVKRNKKIHWIIITLKKTNNNFVFFVQPQQNEY